MNSILNEIVAYKRLEVEARLRMGLYKKLEQMAAARINEPKKSMSHSILNSSSGIIAEFKRRSPSCGDIHPMANPADVVAGYVRGGAAACSILTDTCFFGGSDNDLIMAANVAGECPVLRKEFIVAEEQIVEAKALGASAVLLIASLLTANEIERYTLLSHNLGLEVLFEIHTADELDKFCSGIDMVGINNRNLATFTTDLSNSRHLVEKLPEGVVKVAESGIKSSQDIRNLRSAGFDGYLVGETLMKNQNPALALKELINGI